MRKLVATIIAVIVLGQSACFAQTDSAFLKACAFAKGDPVDSVKAFYGIHVDPKKLPTITPGQTEYEYRFSQWGVWVFFNKDLRVTTIRFDAPFAGKIGGIVVGENVDQIRRLRGEPAHQFQGMPDAGALEERKREKADLLASLPHPASLEERLDMIDDMARIDNKWPLMMTAWTYGDLKTRDFVRYDISPEDSKVHSILAASCEKES